MFAGLYEEISSEESIFCDDTKHRCSTFCRNDNISNYAHVAYIYMFSDNVCIIITIYYAYHACAGFSSK